MLRIAVIIVVCIMSAMAQTTISDTILSPFGGGNWTGKIRISCPRTTSTTGGTIALETYSATVTNGVLSITIRPYDTASPSSTCTARYEGATGVWQESWLIPTSGGSVKVSDILRPAPSSGTVAYVPAPPVCAATPPTTGAYRHQCLGTDKKVYTCANSLGCTLAGDWGTGGGATLPSVTNLLAGDGSGGASDSGLSAASVATLSGTQSLTNKTLDGISPTIMGYLANVSSDIQSQIGAKFTDPLTTRGDLIYRSAGGTTRLALGANGYCLTSDGTDAVWAACPGGGANANGYYLVGRSTNAPANAINLGALTTGLVKNSVSGGVSTISTAASGTDYAPATSGSAILKGDGFGGFSSATVGTDYMRPGQVYSNLVSITNAGSPYTVASTVAYILCNATAGAVVINLPAATGTGREISIKKTDSSSNACTPTRSGSDTIDGATSYSITTQYASSKVVDAASASWHRSHVNQLGGALGGISTAATITGISSTQYMLPVSSSTAGQLGTSTTLLNGGVFYPSSDSTTAIQFNKAGGSTNVLTLDTTNSRVGVLTASPGATLDVAKTSTYTARFYDQTATTGTTRVVLRAGAGDAAGDHLLEGFANDGTTSKWYVTRDGTFNISATGGITLGAGVALTMGNSGTITLGPSGADVRASGYAAFTITNPTIQWPSNTPDLSIARNAAGILEVNNGTAGRFADIKVRHLRTGTIATYAPAPTISSGFGTSPSIAGSDSAGRVTIGNPTGTSGVITFGTAWGTAPACTANDEVTGVAITTAATTTQLTLAGSFVAADTVVFTCIGY